MDTLEWQATAGLPAEMFRTLPYTFGSRDDGRFIPHTPGPHRSALGAREFWFLLCDHGQKRSPKQLRNPTPLKGRLGRTPESLQIEDFDRSGRLGRPGCQFFENLQIPPNTSKSSETLENALK